jgi:hypothetical protein
MLKPLGFSRQLSAISHQLFKRRDDFPYQPISNHLIFLSHVGF